MRITYLQHSGFAVESGEAVLIFDYYKGALPKFPKDKQVYVFASHAHYDHFKKAVFDWEDTYDNITYILSDDIKESGPEGKTIPVKARQEMQVDKLKIKTLRSTDEGVAFFVRLEDKVIYHAGDLNWWHWEEESAVYNELMKRNYQRELKKIEGEHIDAAFVPVDPRLGGQYFWGLDYFMKHTDTDCVFPMHMWGQYEMYDRLMAQEETKEYRERIMHITREGQVFEGV